MAERDGTHLLEGVGRGSFEGHGGAANGAGWVTFIRDSVGVHPVQAHIPAPQPMRPL